MKATIDEDLKQHWKCVECGHVEEYKRGDVFRYYNGRRCECGGWMVLEGGDDDGSEGRLDAGRRP